MNQIKDLLGTDAYEALKHENLVFPHQILTTHSNTLQDITRQSSQQINQIKLATAELILQDKIKTANSIEPWERFSTGCTSVDSILRGGFPLNGISEIYGCSGAGKTQLCLQLALQIQLPYDLCGKEKGAVYISTEEAFPSKRLLQLANGLRLKHMLDIEFENHIYLEHIADSRQFQKCLKVTLPGFMQSKNVGLIVVDSIAGLFRGDEENPSYVLRSRDFKEISMALNDLQDRFKCAVVVVNQVADNLATGKFEPCLGLAWANNVTCRFCINRSNDSPVRSFEVVFAPDLPCATANVLITSEGIVDFTQ